MSGESFGSTYLLGDRIGSGATGTVVRATDRDGGQYAVKLLRSELAEDQALVQRFVQERSALTGVEHPHVVRVHDLVVEGGRLGLVMDLVEGGDLRGVLTTRGPLPPAEAAGIAGQVAAGLAAVHAAGLVHRDVKPENVLMDLTGGSPVARISDFGIARLVDASAGSRSSLPFGTVNYVAPEIADGQTATGAADVYSLGILTYELCSGVTPFEGGSQLAVLRRHADAPLQRPPGVPDQLWAAIRDMLHKDPTRRPTAAQVGPYLERLSAELVGQPAASALTAPLPVAAPAETSTQTWGVTPAPASAPHTPQEPPRRGRKGLVAALLVAALVLGGGGYLAAQAFLGGDEAAAGPDDGDVAGATETATETGAPAAAESADQAPAEETEPAAPSDTAATEEPTTEEPTTEEATTEEPEPEVMPDVVGGSLAAARADLRGVTIEVVEEFDVQTPDNQVLAQSVTAGEEMPEKVTLTVAKQPVTVYLDSLSAISEDDLAPESAQLNGESYPRSLTSRWWGAGYGEWNLSRGYRQLVATVGRSDDAGSSSETVQVEVFLDQRKVWSERAVLGETIDLNVDVTDALRLRIEYTPLGEDDADIVLGDIHLLGLPGEVPEPEEE